MNNFSFSVFNLVSVFAIILFMIFAVCPFELIDMKQAQRIAKWKSKYEEFDYCFKLVDIYEGIIAEKNDIDEDISNKLIVSKIKTYLNLSEDSLIPYKKYGYKRKNGRIIPMNSQFYFDKFLKCKDGSLISFKKSHNTENKGNYPLYYMFVDINGEEKPNRIGHDIFFINIYSHEIKALGFDKEYARMKKNCSPVGSGLYCSEFYLLGGHF